MKVRQNGEYKKRKFENIVRRSDGYIVFSHMNAYGMLPVVILISQCKNITSIDMTIKKLESPRPILTILVKTLHHRLLT